ncbi:uncharacterized protein WM277_012889 isoform 2-T2 [Molossus nigricans]
MAFKLDEQKILPEGENCLGTSLLCWADTTFMRRLPPWPKSPRSNQAESFALDGGPSLGRGAQRPEVLQTSTCEELSVDSEKPHTVLLGSQGSSCQTWHDWESPRARCRVEREVHTERKGAQTQS